MMKMFSNVSEGFLASAYAVLGAKLFLPTRYIDYGTIPVISMLNGLESMWLFGATIGLASIAMSFTQDFVGMWFKNSPYYNSVSKVSRPISMGLLAIGVSAVISGFDVSMRGIMVNFLLGSISNVLGQYSSDVIYPAELKIVDQLKTISMPKAIPIPNIGPVIDFAKKPEAFIPDIGFGGFGGFNGFY